MDSGTVIVPWENQNGEWWNETCALIMEHFGLPGGKYVTSVSVECMSFVFYDDRDALMCRLLISEKV
jgi:hypothetical protein